MRSRDTSDNSPLNVTKTSRSSDYTLTPVARSYENGKWESSPGPFNQILKIKKCNQVKCTVRVPPVEPYSTTGSFFLLSFKNPNTFEQELSRFFSQSTFGATKDMIANWAYSEDRAGMAQYIKDQVNLPLTSLRETYRRGADFSLGDESVGNAAVVPIHPCARYSRWRDYSLSGDDYGKAMTVESFSGRLLVSVEGMPRTIVDSFRSTDTTFDGAGNYNMGKTILHQIIVIVVINSIYIVKY